MCILPEKETIGFMMIIITNNNVRQYFLLWDVGVLSPVSTGSGQTKLTRLFVFLVFICIVLLN